MFFKKIIQSIIIDKYFLDVSRKTDFIIHSVILLILISPIFFIGVYSVILDYIEMTNFVYEDHKSILDLSSRIIKERLDNFVDMGKFLVKRSIVVDAIKNKNFKESEELFKNIIDSYSSIDSIFMTDVDGIMLSRIPEFPENIGKSFAYRDWYQGVSKNWENYFSGVYKRVAEPKINVRVMAFPVKDESGKPIGILVFQYNLDTFLKWSKEINVGKNGFVYFIDKDGQIVAHPQISLQDGIISDIGSPAVQNLLVNKSGVEVFYDQKEDEDFLIAYNKVPQYDFGVLVKQPKKDAFAERNLHFISDGLFYSFIFLLNLFFALFFIQILHNLNYTRQKEKTFLESIGDGVVAIDRNWNIVLWNKAASKISGWKENETIGKSFREIIKFIKETDRSEDIIFIEESMLYGKSIQMKEGMLLIKKDGKEIPVGDMAAPVLDINNNVVGVIIVFRDMTQERESRALRSDFAYASHQLRTPINAALWNIESVMKENNIDKIKESIEISYISLKKVHKEVVQLINVSEIDQKMVMPKIQPVKLFEVVDEAVKSVEKEIDKSKMIKISIPPISATASINIDAILFKKILVEIIDNAVNFSNFNGEVKIRVDFKQDGVLIEVEDFGIGIPEEQQSLIFTKFFRGHNVSSKIIGAGLGLYICKGYVQLLNGRIWFKSESGKGTTFSIFFPINNK